jgi:hypothetical protein
VAPVSAPQRHGVTEEDKETKIKGLLNSFGFSVAL